MATFDFVVTTAAELMADIASINAGGANSVAGASYTITIRQDLNLTTNITPINLASGCSLTISGKGGGGNPRATLDGGGVHEGFVVQSGAVTLDSLNLTAMVATGKAGGAGLLPGGGGAGLGGAVFVGPNANVDLSNVDFTGDSARGGAGGAGKSSGVGAGGASSDGLIGTGGAGGAAAGFGGGGGGGAAGGFGGGSNGGGGLGAGGDVFVAQGGTLTISGGQLAAGRVLGGAAHHKGGTAGSAFGNGLFIQGDQTVSIANETVTGVIADQAGSGGTGAGALNISGLVTLSAANTFTGGIVVAPSSVLTLANAQAAGSGRISLSANDELVIGLGDSPKNAIAGLSDNNGVTIDLQAMGLAKRAALNAANQLTLSGGGVTPVTLNFDPSANYSNDTFQVVTDNAGGTLVRAVQTTYDVASESDLNAAIQSIDLTGAQSQPNLAYTIKFTTSFALSTDLYAINLATGDTLTIRGANYALSGSGAERGFFVYSGVVAIENLTMENMTATGGAGGAAADPGGGGAGLGGALFIGSQGAVTLSRVQFLNDSAVGGAGGAIGASGWGGGGGLGGAGGSDVAGGEGGGGGVGSGAVGGSTGNHNGGTGILLGAAGGSGGSGTYSGNSGPGIGGADGGGGGWGDYFSGGGGRGGGRSTPGEGGAGGVSTAQNFGGGAGPGRLAGFGGGGAAFAGGPNGSPNPQSGDGGFGGGGAGGGLGGFGGGAGSGGGGGGLGAGGAIFVEAGGSLTFGAGSLSGGSAIGGAGSGGAGAGLGFGAGVFTQGGALTFDPGAGQTLTVSDAIADEAGSGGAGSTSLVLTGAGAVVLGATNTYTGGTSIGDAGLSLEAPGAAGSGVIDFVYGAAATLTIGAGDVPQNLIYDFAPGDAVLLQGVGTETSAILGANNTLAITGGSTPVQLHLDPTQDYSGYTFKVAGDGPNDSLLSISTPGGVQPPHIAGAGLTIQGYDNAALTPLAGVTVEDVNPSATETATLTLSATANGVLSNLGLGTYNPLTGVYSVTGGASAVTAALDALIFTPADHEVMPGGTVSTTFALSVSNGTLVDKASDVANVTAVNTPPAINNMPASFQPGYFTVPDTPFAGATVVDPDLGAVETATIGLSNADFNGYLSLAGPVDGVSLTETGPGSGVYDLSAGTPAAISAALDAIQFTPAYNASGFTITTMSVAVSDGTATTTASTSVLAGAPVITGGVSGQATLDTQPIDPFKTVTVTDSPEFLSDQLTITLIDPVSDLPLSSDANGLLSGQGLTHIQPGQYTLTPGTPAQLTSLLDALAFSPTAHQGAAGSTIATGFELSVFNGASTSDNYNTSVVATETAKALAQATTRAFGTI